jgi:hypothetical protein
VVISKDKSAHWMERVYIWSHISLRSWGIKVSQQCPSCRQIRSWNKPRTLSKVSKTADGSKLTMCCITHGCQRCSYSRSFDKPTSWTYLSAVGECGRGEWYFTHWVISGGIP